MRNLERNFSMRLMSIYWLFLFFSTHYIHWICVVFSSFHSYGKQMVIFCLFITANICSATLSFYRGHTPIESYGHRLQLWCEALDFHIKCVNQDMIARFLLIHFLSHTHTYTHAGTGLTIHCFVMSPCEMGLCYTKSSRNGSLVENISH